MNKPYPAVEFEGFESITDTATTATGRGGQGGEPIFTFPNGRKLRFDGEFFYIPNTIEGQRLALLITGSKQSADGGWILLYARQWAQQIDGLLSIVTAMIDAATPALPENYQEKKNLLVSLGGRGKPVERVARDTWATLEIITAWADELKKNNSPEKFAAVLMTNLELRLTPPGLLTETHYVTTPARRGDVVRVIADNRQGTVDGFLHDGTITVMMEDNFEIDFYRADQIEVIEITS